MGDIGSFQRYGVIGLISGAASLLLLLASMLIWIRNQESVYFLARPEQVGGSRTPLSDLFEIPVYYTYYTEQLPFKELLESDLGFYFTTNCRMPSMPQQLSFFVGQVFEPRRIHVAMNLREGRSFINDQALNGKIVGYIVLEFDTGSESDRYTFLELMAGQNVREWLIGASDQGIDIVRDTTSLDTHEAYYGTAKPSGLKGVIDLITLQVPDAVPDEPLVRVWVLDSSQELLNSCDPGFQVMGVVVEARREPNKTIVATNQTTP